jgi:PhoPQ-activated pathogenicity-related protein
LWLHCCFSLYPYADNWTRLPQFDETADGYKVLFMNMTSQSWLTEADVDKSVWWHWVALVVPANLSPEFASRGLMYITGGNNNLSPPKLVSEDLIVAAVLAQTCQTVVTVLFQIPNSPIHFWAQPGAPGHSEDGIIAYGWRQFLNNPTRPEWSA